LIEICLIYFKQFNSFVSNKIETLVKKTFKEKFDIKLVQKNIDSFINNRLIKNFGLKLIN
jgi:hypothetical protein